MQEAEVLRPLPFPGETGQPRRSDENRTVSTISQTTYYEILRVAQTASPEAIQASFRRLAKDYHPDRNRERTRWAEAKMREILEAYRILSSRTDRVLYDRKLRTRATGVPFVQRMRQKQNDLAAQSKLVLHYLLKGEFDRAVELHETLSMRKVTFTLADHLDDRDYLDSLFLLGEAYEGQRKWRTAARYYWEAYERERTGPRKRYFFEELKDRLRVLFSQRLVRGLAPEDALKNYRRALSLGIGSRNAALIYKKIATVHNRLGRRDEAVRALERAKSLCPGMKSIEVMRQKIAGH